jgi:acetyl-CoA carboxylase, biotin carboxylase subunit
VFSCVLIANRGEIAVRVARTCRELNIRTIAVCSTADLGTGVARLADKCIHIGPALARRSYLNAAAIVEAARQHGAEAIHPGYGFLSEDPLFAEVCEAYGLRFIGPPAHVLERLGEKSRARSMAARAGLPLLAGSTGPVDSIADIRAAAVAAGFPIIIKAVAGGGGRGMSVVTAPSALTSAYQHARASALAVFGDSRVYVEQFLHKARHIEVQILADGYGNVVHLGARNCSTQRRRQKLIEEGPPPGLRPAVIERICADAVRLARHAGYLGAGTVEFLVDEAGQHYFMEVNCRIQVEHPVTELLTGVDLVREQLAIAAGEPLTPRVGPPAAHCGAAIECRVNAEDPDRDFQPTPAEVVEFMPPGGPFVRVDTHVTAGVRVGPHYDPLLAKVVVWAPDRAQAIARMDRALAEFRVSGPGLRTTIEFLRRTLAHESFRAGNYTLDLVDEVIGRAAPSGCADDQPT